MTLPPTTISLSGDCSIRTITGLHATMQDGFREGEGDVVVDMAAVEDADVTLIQLMIAAARTASTAGRAFSIVNMPGPIAACFGGAGVDVTRLATPA